MLTPLPRVMGNGWGREDAITSLRCITPDAHGCGRQIAIVEFMQWDRDTIFEYRQSGWCNKCQDKIFRDPDDCTCEYVDVGLEIPLPNPMNVYCPEHGDPDCDERDEFYDPDLREDELPHDITEIAWPVHVL